MSGRSGPTAPPCANSSRRPTAACCRRSARADLDRPGDPLLDHAEAVFTVLEHEAMHQETLLYIWHRLPFSAKHRPAGYSPRTAGTVPRPEWIAIPEGVATLGVDRGTIPFGWDNEFPSRREQVPPFSIERDNVTNARYLEFVDAGGYRDAALWRPDDWAWLQTEGVRHPLFWEQLEGQMVLARDVRSDSAAAGLARLRDPRRSHGLRQVERRAPADGRRISTRRVRLARG